jgi:hypothetical protein
MKKSKGGSIMKKQGVGGKPTNVKTFAANGGIINKNKPGNSGLYGRR